MTNKRVSLQQKLEFLADKWISYTIVKGMTYDENKGINVKKFIVTREDKTKEDTLYTSKSLPTAITKLYNDINNLGKKQ